jgi:peptidoglycan/LPS O-acetylase OafA/YrhL
VPIAAAVLLSFAVYKMGWYMNEPAARISGSMNWLFNFFRDGVSLTEALKDAIFKSIFFGDNSLNVSLWTLKFEFVGSLYLLAYYLVKPKTSSWLPMVMMLSVLVLTYRSDSVLYVAIFAGSLLNALKVDGWFRLLIMVAGAYFGAFQFERAMYDFLPSAVKFGLGSDYDKIMYNTVGACLVVLGVVNGFAKDFFQSRFLQFLGRVSFSIYLVHFIILCSLSCFIYLRLPKSGAYLMLNFGIYLSACFIAAMAFEKMVDVRAIRWARQFATKFAH